MKLLGCCLVVFVTSCAFTTKYKMSVTSTTPVTAKPATCEFKVATLPPTGDYEEIAILTPDGSHTPSTTPEEFKAHVRTDVCRVGGDIVVTEINGMGEYVRGTVLRMRAPSTASQ